MITRKAVSTEKQLKLNVVKTGIKSGFNRRRKSTPTKGGSLLPGLRRS